MVIFDGQAFAQQKEALLQVRVGELLRVGIKLRIAAILFKEDAGSQIYTTLKSEAAARVGIEYEVFEHSLRDSPDTIIKTIEKLNADAAVTGIIIQKPWRKTWVSERRAEQSVADGAESKKAFAQWWSSLTSRLAVEKDVDGLHPSTLQAIAANTWGLQGRVLPATCQAVWEIMGEARALEPDTKIVILGKSDLLGQPLFYELKNNGYRVELLGTREFSARLLNGQKLFDADCVVSATGQAGLITGDMLKSGVVVIDVGEPQPDVNRESVSEKARFITPVPGGVGPVTVVCLLENCLKLSMVYYPPSKK